MKKIQIFVLLMASVTAATTATNICPLPIAQLQLWSLLAGGDTIIIGRNHHNMV